MPEEEYTIRIRRDGRIEIEGEGVTPRQIKDIAAFLSETVGPLRIEAGSDAGGRVELSIEDLATDGIADEEQVGERLRLREMGPPPE